MIPASDIDRLLLSFSDAHWRKVARIIGQTYEALEERGNEIFRGIAKLMDARMAVLVRSGKLEAKPPSTTDDLAQVVKEAEFLNILEHIKAITKAENKELSSCLDRRNTAGHPNSHTFTEVGVGNHIETLLTSVYRRF